MKIKTFFIIFISMHIFLQNLNAYIFLAPPSMVMMDGEKSNSVNKRVLSIMISTVQIEIMDNQHLLKSHKGNGVIISVQGKKVYILTNNHIIKDGLESSLRLEGFAAPFINPQIIKTDFWKDLALIKGELNQEIGDFPTVCFSNIPVLCPTEITDYYGPPFWVYINTLPCIQQPLFRKDVELLEVLRKGVLTRSHSELIADIESRAGDSGSPVCDKNGFFVGMVKSSITHKIGCVLGMPSRTGLVSINEIRDFLQDTELQILSQPFTAGSQPIKMTAVEILKAL